MGLESRQPGARAQDLNYDAALSSRKHSVLFKILSTPTCWNSGPLKGIYICKVLGVVSVTRQVSQSNLNLCLPFLLICAHFSLDVYSACHRKSHCAFFKKIC